MQQEICEDCGCFHALIVLKCTYSTLCNLTYSLEILENVFIFYAFTNSMQGSGLPLGSVPGTLGQRPGQSNHHQQWTLRSCWINCGVNYTVVQVLAETVTTAVAHTCTHRHYNHITNPAKLVNAQRYTNVLHCVAK